MIFRYLGFATALFVVQREASYGGVPCLNWMAASTKEKYTLAEILLDY
jgi:hypothetical protein